MFNDFGVFDLTTVMNIVRTSPLQKKLEEFEQKVGIMPAEGQQSFFQKNWAIIKSKIKDIYATPKKLDVLYENYEKILRNKGATKEQKDKALEGMKRINELHKTARKVNDVIDSAKEGWEKLTGEKINLTGLGCVQRTHSYSGFGALPIVIAGIAAAGFVAVYGLGLLKDYATEARIQQDFTAGKISLSEAKTLQESAAKSTFTGSFGSAFGSAFSTPLILVAIGAGLFLFFKFGNKPQLQSPQSGN